jgi:ABC-type nitrate/sulfonate/bicarbonate transport system permease component
MPLSCWQCAGIDGGVVLHRLCSSSKLLPVATLDFFNAWMHGLDLTMLKSDQAMSLGKLTYGLFGATLVGFLSGVVLASSYNLHAKRSRCR